MSGRFQAYSMLKPIIRYTADQLSVTKCYFTAAMNFDANRSTTTKRTRWRKLPDAIDRTIVRRTVNPRDYRLWLVEGRLDRVLQFIFQKSAAFQNRALLGSKGGLAEESEFEKILEGRLVNEDDIINTHIRKLEEGELEEQEQEEQEQEQEDREKKREREEEHVTM